MVVSPEDTILFEKIADGLATDGFAITDNFLDPDAVTAILNTDEFKDRLLQFRKAGIGKRSDLRVNELIRGDSIHWLDPAIASAPLKAYHARLHSLLQFLNQALFLSLREAEVHLTAYPVGTFYKRHLDQFKKDDHRRLSVICYLNEGWVESDGGQLRLYLADSTLDIMPLAGRLACFRSDHIEHEVIAARRERLSLTGWMLDKPVGLPI